MRFRADYNQTYWYVNAGFGADFNEECNTRTDDRLYESGNYFETRDEAEAVAAKIHAILKEHHEAKEGGLK